MLCVCVREAVVHYCYVRAAKSTRDRVWTFSKKSEQEKKKKNISFPSHVRVAIEFVLRFFPLFCRRYDSDYVYTVESTVYCIDCMYTHSSVCVCVWNRQFANIMVPTRSSRRFQLRFGECHALNKNLNMDDFGVFIIINE